MRRPRAPRPILLFISFALLPISCQKQAQESPVTEDEQATPQDELPQAVLDGLKDRFPGAKIQKWTREKEGDVVIYDFEFEQEGRKLEADVREDGSIFNWEKAIEATELPAAAIQAAYGKYPGATLLEIMEITRMDEGTEALEGYEIVLKTMEDKKVEVMVSPGGEVLEDSGDEKSDKP